MYALIFSGCGECQDPEELEDGAYVLSEYADVVYPVETSGMSAQVSGRQLTVEYSTFVADEESTWRVGLDIDTVFHFEDEAQGERVVCARTGESASLVDVTRASGAGDTAQQRRFWEDYTHIDGGEDWFTLLTHAPAWGDDGEGNLSFELAP